MRLDACGSWWAGLTRVEVGGRDIASWREMWVLICLQLEGGGRTGEVWLTWDTIYDFDMRKKRNTHVNQSCML